METMDVPQVLVVDDNLPTCRALVRLLKLSGYSAICVESGRAALDYLKTCEPSVVFLDISMPGMDGFEVLQLIRANEKCHSVKVLMYSAVSNDEYRKKAAQAGANGYIVKGEPFERIKEVLRAHLPGV